MSQRHGAERLGRVASIFRLLADPTRLDIIVQLRHGEQNVTQLSAQLDLPQPTVSHHLALLRDGKVLLRRRVGRTVYYKLDPHSDYIQDGELRIEIDETMHPPDND